MLGLLSVYWKTGTLGEEAEGAVLDWAEFFCKDGVKALTHVLVKCYEVWI